MHTLAFLEPGHFHAALTLRVSNPCVSEEVHLYARPGPERETFLALVDSFNSRTDRPTPWRVQIRDSSDPLAELIHEQKADVVVLAGRNDTKLATIARLHDAGFAVLADKPWLVTSDALGYLEHVTVSPPLAMDIMTTRFDTTARLIKKVTERDALFGSFVTGAAGEPAIEVTSVHHLYKIVNGAPLRRPPWYYDISVQGDGMVDIQSHMVDQVQWLLEGEDAWDYRTHVELDSARRWSTPVQPELFRSSTGQSRFPDELAEQVVDGVLQLAANGEIAYRMRGIPVCQRAEWRQREPAGGGDLHAMRICGSHARLVLTQDPETDFAADLRLIPESGEVVEDRLHEALADWQAEFPGLSVVKEGNAFRFRIPAALASGHEKHFAMALDTFLDYLDTGPWPEALARRISLRYTLLARARELALRNRRPSP